MEHPRIEEDRIVDRYLSGRLSADDEVAFEEHLFECAGCLEKVQWGEELRRGLQAVAAEDSARTATTLGLVAWLRGRRPPQLAGLAGLALAVVMLPAIVIWQQAEMGRMQATIERLGSRAAGLVEPTGAFLVVSLGTVRDVSGDIAEIRLDPDKDAVLLSLELETVDASRYRVTLRDDGGDTLWTGDGLEPNLYDTLLVALPSSYLAPGRYWITIEGLAAAGLEPVGELPFRVSAGD